MDIKLRNGTDLTIRLPRLTAYELDLIQNASAVECDDAENYAGDRRLWEDYIDPDATTDYETEPYDNRVALALLVIALNR